MAKAVERSPLLMVVFGGICLLIALGWFNGIRIHQRRLVDHKQARLHRSTVLDGLRTRYSRHEWIGEYRVEGIQEYAFALGLAMGASQSQARQWLDALPKRRLYGFWDGSSLWQAGEETRLSSADLLADHARQPLIFVLPNRTAPPRGFSFCPTVDFGKGYSIFIERFGAC